MAGSVNKVILNTQMCENDAGAATIGEYLSKLLLTLWRDGECFSAKRPFGNSGWEYELYLALVIGGHINGTLDEFGFIEDCDTSKADSLIAEVICEALK